MGLLPLLQAYLPSGRWVQFFTEEEFAGPGWVTVPAPLRRPTAFFREDTDFTDLFRGVSKMELNLVMDDKSKMSI